MSNIWKHLVSLLLVQAEGGLNRISATMVAGWSAIVVTWLGAWALRKFGFVLAEGEMALVTQLSVTGITLAIMYARRALAEIRDQVGKLKR